ncbi:HAD-hyrolase-like protein [Fragilaria crotonensis]|nr:HAD-hyrolase-like protein [Fragilaria crotonensis]
MMQNTLVWSRDSGHPPFDMDLSSAKMIVFDKDGTLGDDKASLKRWACHMTDRIEETIMGLHVAQRNRDPRMLHVLVTEFHNQIGWDPVQQRVLPSAPLAAGTWDEQITTLQTLLNQYQLDDTNIVAAAWHSQVELHSGDNPVIPNLRGMLLDCQNRGLRITVCTSDERQSTDQALQNWKVQDIISDSICGDEVDNPKPSAEPLERLCQRGGVAPHECIVVGDTISDVGMARNSKALFCIGVLTGSGTAEQLTEMGANIVVPSVEHIPELLSACGLVPGT